MAIDVYLFSSYRGWIMEAIPRESAKAIGLKVRMRFVPVGLKERAKPRNIVTFLSLRKPSLRLYMNHMTYLQHKSIRRSKTRVFVTHLDESHQLGSDDIQKLSKVDTFFVQNHAMKLELMRLGINENSLEVVFGAVSGREFYPIEQSSEIEPNQVLIVGDCKPRKNPKLIEDTVRRNQDFNFVIHGKNWERFTTLSANPPVNLRMLDFDANQHPRLVRQSVALLSLASNEGGPFPILEAFASGTPVIATATGFAPDLIDQDKGVLLPLTPTPGQIRSGLQSCRRLKLSTWNQDLTQGKLTWEELGTKLFK